MGYTCCQNQLIILHFQTHWNSSRIFRYIYIRCFMSILNLSIYILTCECQQKWCHFFLKQKHKILTQVKLSNIRKFLISELLTPFPKTLQKSVDILKTWNAKNLNDLKFYIPIFLSYFIWNVLEEHNKTIFILLFPKKPERPEISIDFKV